MTRNPRASTRRLVRALAGLALGVLGLALARPAPAADISDLGVTQQLRPRTVIRAEIVDPATESIYWFAEWDDGGTLVGMDVELYDPTDTLIGTFASGSTITVSAGPGAYYLRPVGVDPDGNGINQPAVDWEITVLGAPADVGRVWSRAWHIDGDNFSNATDGSFYAVVDGGAPLNEGVVELKSDGLVGFIYFISASRDGIVPNGNGRSRDQNEDLDGDGNPDWSARAEYSIYLRPPDPAVVGYNWLQPAISNTTLETDGLCDGVALGISGATLSFDSNVDGIYHFVCDVNGDGVFDLTGDDDFHLLDEADVGTNEVAWDGSDNLGQPVPPGVYDCQVLLTVGEFHFVASDIESSYEGFRVFEVDAAQSRTGLDMYWNDAEVQSKAILMPNNQVGLETSGPFGVYSGDYTDPTVPNVNARSWGDPGVQQTKGNASYLDTYTWLGDDVSAPFQVEVLDATTDTDSDLLLDAEEDCLYGTDPNNPDTDGDGAGDHPEATVTDSDPLNPDSDGDGYLDGEELPDPYYPADSDGDGLEDAVDPDDDNDGLDTIFEAPGDTDGDGLDDRIDDDDDGDGAPTASEDTNGDGDWTNDDNDGDGLVDYLDPDDDDDGVIVEDPNGDGDASNDDTDGDGILDHFDEDDDGDGIRTEDEYDVDGDGVPDDTDEDGIPDYLDPDDDNDGLDTADEVAGNDVDGDGFVEPDEFLDTDGDGIPDHFDEDSDADNVPDGTDGLDDTDGDGIPNFQDPDDDGDGLDTILEDFDDTDGDGIPDDSDGDPTNNDSDGDGIPDYLDPDDDNDGIDSGDEYTEIEDVDGDGDIDIDDLDDRDNDGLPNHLDDDADGDGIPDADEQDIDTDGDGVPDFLDLDSDNDTIPDATEGLADTDGDFRPDFQDIDDDGDGIDTIEELQDAAGTPGDDTDYADLGTEPDTDGDGTSDYLDDDDDDDGLLTIEEGGFDDDFDGDGVPNHHDPDSDDDGILDGTEGSEDLDGDGNGNFIDLDADGDGYDDEVEGEVDSDGDGWSDFLDTDDDDDQVPTAEERPGDTDGDGIDDRLDTDDDGDGIDTSVEVDDGLIHGEDVDDDGDENWVDTDSDGDGELDADEGTGDIDGDDVPNYLDPDGGYVEWYRGTGLSSSCSTGASPAGMGGTLLAMLAVLGFSRRRE